MAILDGFEYISPPDLEQELKPLRASMEDAARSVYAHGRHLNGIDSQIGSIEARLADIEDALGLIGPPLDKPGLDEIEISSSAELAALSRSWEAGAQYVFTKSMTSSVPLTGLPAGVQIRALDGVSVKISAFVPFQAEFEYIDGYWRAPYTHHLRKHPATREGDWDGHRDRMAAHQFVAGGKMLKPVYKKADLQPGTFWVEGDAEDPDFVWIAINGASPAGKPPSDVFYAHHATLLSGEPGVSVEGLTFEGGASTGKSGAVKVGDGWHLKGCTTRLSAGPGFHVSGKNITLEDCTGELNGQLNYLVHKYENVKLINCLSRGGNRKGFNAAYEAGGAKIVNTWEEPGIGLEVIGFKSIDDDGPGLWFDINNREVIVRDALVENALAAAVMFEHGFYNGLAQNIVVRGVRSYPVPTKTWSRRDGIVFQSNIFDSEFYDLYASDCHHAVLYKKDEKRGGSGRNIFHRLTASDITGLAIYKETMNDEAILKAIAAGATPNNLAGWHQADDIQEIHHLMT